MLRFGSVTRKWRTHGLRLTAVAVLAACSVFASGCLIIEPSFPGAFGTGHYPIQYDYGVAVPIPGYEKYPVQPCLIRGSEVPGRRDVCRVIIGSEEHHDWRNWHIYSDPPPKSYEYISGYGWTIVTDGGGAYEGCKRLDPTPGAVNDWDCDYKVIMMTALVSGDSAPRYVWEKFKDWTIDTGSIAGCAAFITSLSRGGKINLPGLTGCGEKLVR